MRRTAYTLPFALTTLLAACSAVGPDYRMPDEAVVLQPAAQKPFDLAGNERVEQAPLPDDWWQLYDDPTLDQLVSEALVGNADVRQAYHNLRRAYEGFQMAHHAQEVVVGGNGSVARGQLSSEALALEEKLPVMNLADAGLSVGYQLDLFGQLHRAAEAAGADADANAALLDTARITAVAGVVRSYMTACHASEELTIAKHSLAIQQQQLDVAERLSVGGRGNEVDVARARAQLEALRAELPPFEAKISWHFPTRVDRARVRATEAGAAAALARFDGVVLNALRETQTLLTHYAHDLHRDQALGEARDAARAAADHTRRLYQEGRLAYLDSLDAERTLATAEAALAASQAQLSQDQVNLFLALGGGWQSMQAAARVENPSPGVPGQ